MNDEILRDRLATLDRQAGRTRDALADLACIVQKLKPQPACAEYKTAERALRTSLDLLAAINDLQDEDDVDELIHFLTGLAKHRRNVAIAKQEDARIVYRNGLQPKHAASMQALYQQHAHRTYGEAQWAREEWFMLERTIATLQAIQTGRLVLSRPGRVP